MLDSDNIDTIIKKFVIDMKNNNYDEQNVYDMVSLLESSVEKKDIDLIMKKLTHKKIFEKSPIDLINKLMRKKNNGHLLFLKNLILDKMKLLDNSNNANISSDKIEKKQKIIDFLNNFFT